MQLGYEGPWVAGSCPWEGGLCGLPQQESPQHPSRWWARPPWVHTPAKLPQFGYRGGIYRKNTIPGISLRAALPHDGTGRPPITGTQISVTP